MKDLNDMVRPWHFSNWYRDLDALTFGMDSISDIFTLYFKKVYICIKNRILTIKGIMKIKKLVVHNYKVFDHLELDFTDPEIT